MPQTVGYRFRGKGDKTAVCKDCVEHLSLRTSGSEELNSGQFADEFCLTCGDNITGSGTIDRSSHELDYPLGLCIIIGAQFDGAYPVIDTKANVKEISPGVKKSVAQRTSHDPVLVKVFPDQSQLLSNLKEFADKASRRGPIRGYTEEYTDEDGNVEGYDVIFFAKQ